MTTRLWLDGALRPTDTARIDPADRGLTLGDGLFETLAVEAGHPLHFVRHLARLQQGAARLGLPCPPDIPAAAAALLRADPRRQAALRLTLTRGPGGRGLLPPDPVKPTLLLTLHPMPAPIDTITARTSASTRRNQKSPLSQIKSLNYLDNILARTEALAEAADDALLLNLAGAPACLSAATLIVHTGGHWTTPRTADGALPGIVRGLLIEKLGIRPTRLTAGDLARADHLFATNSLSIQAITRLDGREYPLAAALLATLREAARP